MTTPTGVDLDALVAVPRARRRPPWVRGLGLIGGAVIVVWAVVAIFAPLIAPYDPLTTSSHLLEPPSSSHLFGTDELGRDVLSRVIYGIRVSLPYPALLVVGSVLIGGVVGAVAGLLGGAIDSLLMRTTDLFFAFPAIILAMAVAAALGPSLVSAVVGLIIVTWPNYARLARSLVLSHKGADFVTASRLSGGGIGHVLLKDLIPNMAGPILVLAALDVGNAVLLLAGLSFLGLGVQPPVAEWGAMVTEGTQNFLAWWIGVFSGAAILTLVLAFNFVGDSLRDAYDPRGSRGGAGVN